jgi:hypothetical protein
MQDLETSATYEVIHEHQRARWVHALTQKDPHDYASLEDDEIFEDLPHVKRRIALYGLRYGCLYKTFRYRYRGKRPDGTQIIKNVTFKCIYHGE